MLLKGSLLNRSDALLSLQGQGHMGKVEPHYLLIQLGGETAETGPQPRAYF